MSSTDISPVVDRLAARIATVPNVGLVHKFSPFTRVDIHPYIVSTINDVDTVRAWWIEGPTMDATKAEARAAGYQRRWWTYTIVGVEGLSGEATDNSEGDDIQTLRTNALAVSDAIDADGSTLGGTCHLSRPVTWAVQPEHRMLIGVAVAYVELRKRVCTLSTPT